MRVDHVTFISTSKAPAAIGPYSQAVKVNRFGVIYTSGQVAIDPVTNKFVDKDIEEQTKQVCENLKAVLEESSFDLSDVVKTTVFLADMNEFKAMNEVYGFYFAHKPSRSTVEVAKLPLGAKVEIEVVAYK